MKEQITSLVGKAVASLGAGLDPRVLRAIKVDLPKDRGHGDFATNAALILAKPLGQPPRAVAERLVALLSDPDLIARTEIAGPGFINFFLREDALSRRLGAMRSDPRLGVPLAPRPQTVVVDYSAPNVAKEMAVHHLRSTVIGDAVVRVLEFLGHKVIRANHIGDWGTQFGMLIAFLEQREGGDASAQGIPLGDLEAFYREAKRRYDEDEAFARTARERVVALQHGDPHCLEMWRRLVGITMEQDQRLYERLDVTLTPKDTMGESMYNDMLAPVVQDLRDKGLAVDDGGAVVVYSERSRNKDGQPLGIIVQKSDGGYLYNTTDVACVKYRVETLGADRLMYFTDSRQRQHLEEVWEICRRAGYLGEGVETEHDAFGMMLGKDGRPFKTRAGGTVKLSDLLDEAESRVRALLAERGTPEGGNLDEIAHHVAIGAVKYADLSKNRVTDYVFDWDQMLSFDGNTAPYLQYAWSRVRSIFRKAHEQPGEIQVGTPQEQELAAALINFPSVVGEVAQKAMPHLLCAYVYGVAGLFMRFYEACPVTKEGVDPAISRSRLALCDLTAKIIERGLGLLGIRVMEHM